MTSKQESIERALSGYRELVQTLSARRTPEFPDPGITMAQMRVLMLLSVVGEMRMSDLAHELGVSLSTLSSVVDRLVDTNLAARRDDPRDRRSVLVSLAAAGAKVLDSFQELGVAHLRELLDHLSADEAEAVTRAVDVLVVAARRISPEGQL
jgi:DNA-binding MarR family transcriptional regulator